jgi:apolipoprotein N-acyltransferase
VRRSLHRGGVATLVVASAGLHALAFPPWSLTLLAWVAVAPFLYALRGLTPGRGFLAGLLWGTAAMWGVGYWVPIALAGYYQQPAWFGVVFSLAASLIFAGSYTAGFAACACWVSARTRGAARVVLTAVLWVAWELARARLLTGDPWLLLGYALVPHVTLIQVADLGGVYLLSFVVVLVNASLVEALAPDPAPRDGAAARRVRARTPGRITRALAPAALVLATVYGYGVARLAVPLPAAPSLPVTVVQGNNDVGTQWRSELYARGFDQYLRMSYDAAHASHPALIVWPENAVTFFLGREPSYQQAIARVLAGVGADLLVGAPHYEGDDVLHLRYFNSAFYLTADGHVTGRYDKTHLLPFAEYFPLRTIEFLRRRFARVRYFTPGDRARLLETRLGKVATVICFEGIFPELVRAQMADGARLLVNLSNDAWLGSGAGPAQHLAMVTLRAVENRTWVVRATTTGISAFIDPYGRVVARTATFTPAVLEARVVPMHVATLYKRYGDVFAYGCLAGAIGAASVLRRRRVDPGSVSAVAGDAPTAAARPS